MAPVDIDITAQVMLLLGPYVCSMISYTLPVFVAPVGVDPVGISWRCLMRIKLEWLGYRMVKKNCDNMLSRFHLIPERDGQTYGQTYGQNCYINIARQYADAR